MKLIAIDAPIVVDLSVGDGTPGGGFAIICDAAGAGHSIPTRPCPAAVSGTAFSSLNCCAALKMPMAASLAMRRRCAGV